MNLIIVVIVTDMFHCTCLIAFYLYMTTCLLGCLLLATFYIDNGTKVLWGLFPFILNVLDIVTFPGYHRPFWWRHSFRTADKSRLIARVAWGRRWPSFVSRWPSFVSRWPSFVSQWPSFVSRWPSFVSRWPSFVSRWPSFVSRWPSFVSRWSSFVSRWPSFVSRWLSFESRCPSFVSRCPSFVSRWLRSCPISIFLGRFSMSSFSW